MRDEEMTVREAMKAIKGGEEDGIGTAATVGTRNRVKTDADRDLEKGMDMFYQGWSHWVVVFVVVVPGNQRITNTHPQLPVRKWTCLLKTKSERVDED